MYCPVNLRCDDRLRNVLEIFANICKLSETFGDKRFQKFSQLSDPTCLLICIVGGSLFIQSLKMSDRNGVIFHREQILFKFLFQQSKRPFKKSYKFPFQFNTVLLNCNMRRVKLLGMFSHRSPFCDVERYPEQSISIRSFGQTHG